MSTVKPFGILNTMAKERYMINNSAEGGAYCFVDLDENEVKLIEHICSELDRNKESYAPTLYIKKCK